MQLIAHKLLCFQGTGIIAKIQNFSRLEIFYYNNHAHMAQEMQALRRHALKIDNKVHMHIT